MDHLYVGRRCSLFILEYCVCVFLGVPHDMRHMILQSNMSTGVLAEGMCQ